MVTHIILIECVDTLNNYNSKFVRYFAYAQQQSKMTCDFVLGQYKYKFLQTDLLVSDELTGDVRVVRVQYLKR